MSALYNAGDVLRVLLPGRVDGQPKARPVLFWMTDSVVPDRVLVSAIFGNITGREWEIKLYPGSHSGITKESVVRLDNTIWINASFVIKTLGSLNTAEFNVIKDAMIKYSDFYRANSPEDFGDNTLDIFHIQISEN